MTRRAYRWTVAAFVILAVGAIVIGAIVVHNYRRIDRQQHELRTTQRQLTELLIETAGAVCVLALAPTKAEERRLVQAYVSGVPIRYSRLGPECQAATRIARQRITGR